jgi:hypothetical protein
MPDFDANEDPLRLSGAGKDEPLDLPKLQPRFMPRTRQLAQRECYLRPNRTARRLGPVLMARSRRAARNACARRIALLGAPPRRRRRLWTMCHGRPPGSQS